VSKVNGMTVWSERGKIEYAEAIRLYFGHQIREKPDVIEKQEKRKPSDANAVA